MQGTVARLKRDNGYGFITPLSGKDVFFSATNLKIGRYDTLDSGDPVYFEIFEGPKGLAAKNVSGISFEELPVETISQLILEAKKHYKRSEISDVAESFDDRFLNIFRLKTSSILNALGISDEHYQKIKKEFSRAIVSYVRGFPLELAFIHPDVFELLCAELLEADGFKVERIGAWNQGDGGVDILAISSIGGVTVNMVVQVKHFKERIDARPIRELSGVLDKNKAHIGLVMSSSGFTKPAIEETSSSLFRMSLEGTEDILSRLSRYGSK